MKKYIVFICLFFLSFMTSQAQSDCVPLGAKHNAVVDYLTQKGFGDGTENGFMDNLIYTTGQMFDEQAFPGGPTGLWELIKSSWEVEYGAPRERSVDELLALLQSKKQLSDKGSQYLSNCYAALLHSNSYDQLQAELDRLQAGFPLSGVSNEESCLITSVLDVLHSSATYWNAFVEQHGIQASWQCITCITGADVRGAIGGFLLGDYICKKLGIANPRKCALIGAAIMGGLYSWLEGLLPRGCKPTCGAAAGAIGGAVTGAIIGTPGWIQHVFLF